MKKLFVTLSCTLLLLSSYHSQAALIWLEPEQTTYQVGDTITVELKVSGFDELLGGFFAELLYSPLQLMLQSWQFGQGFDDGLGSYQWHSHDAVAGILQLDDYADFSADTAVLFAQQGSTFSLVRLSFTALTAGQFSLGLAESGTGLLSFSNHYLPLSLQGTSINVVNPAQVPLPATALLFASGLLMLSRQRQKAKG